MNIVELAQPEIPFLTTEDTAIRAMNLMSDLGLSRIPVLEDNRFVGFISDDILLDSHSSRQLVGEFEIGCRDCYVGEDVHFYDVLKLAYDHRIDMIALVDDKMRYAGVIFVEDVFRLFALSTPVQTDGSILIISLDKIDYQLKEIVSILESEHVAILSIWTEDDPVNEKRTRVTIKTNALDLKKVEHALERFNYRLESKFEKLPSMTNEQQRFDNLIKYLNI